MATNAKEYKDLAAAESLSANDLVAIAQQDKEELVTTPVSGLSQEIAKEISDGPLSELEMAVSIGKTQLAQRLTEKGAASTTQDTLVQMADKLNNLVINDQLTNVVCKAITAVTKVGNTDTYYSIQYVNGGDLIVLDNSASKLYYIRKGAYQGMQSAIASAISSVDIPAETSKYRLMSISQNEKYIVIDTGDQQLSVYEINVEAGTITLTNTIATSSAIYRRSSTNSQTGYASFVSNDGDIVGYLSNSGRTCNIKRISTDTDLSVSASSSISGFATIDQENNAIYIKSSSSIYKIAYDFDTSSATLSTIGAVPSGRFSYIEPRMQKLIVAKFDFRENPPGGYSTWMCDLTLSIYDPSTITLEDSVVLYRQFLAPAGTGYDRSYPFYGTQPMVKNNGDGTFDILRPTHPNNPVVYDTNQKKFTSNELAYESMNKFSSYWSIDGQVVCLGASDTTVWAVIPDSSTMPVFGPCLYAPYIDSYVNITYTEDEKFFGYSREASDGRYALFGLSLGNTLNNGIMDTIIDTGIMDLETTEVPLS